MDIRQYDLQTGNKRQCASSGILPSLTTREPTCLTLKSPRRLIQIFDARAECRVLNRRRMLTANQSLGCIRRLAKGLMTYPLVIRVSILGTAYAKNRQDQTYERFVMEIVHFRSRLKTVGAAFTELHKSISLFSDSKILKRACYRRFSLDRCF